MKAHASPGMKVSFLLDEGAGGKQDLGNLAIDA
jgi:hypothetical protein